MTILEFIDSIAGYIKKYAATYNVCCLLYTSDAADE